ncbi:hypothetical protein [Magnetospirillum sp. UT-4]|uniref:hypothetical protein n=1 Tax=Magnetospirillum sp. UT-4 TaxID=2681467 RepID=UPI00137F8277|nr:hypothetical protein [Magnetospirillum sp. UT-4]CAA7616711.1 conserved hypothetical protein [Magnetospirillum sp. UT-4]
MAAKSRHAEELVDALMAAAAESGWRGLSLADISDRAGVPLAEAAEMVRSPADLLDLYARRIDRRMLEGGTVPGETARDRLFDVVMRRFEAMSPDRAALAVILRQSGDDPWTLARGGRRLVKSMALTLEAAGLSSAGLCGLARTNGLCAVYLYALRAFLDDDSPDLSRTMSSLDTALRRAEGLAGLMRGRRPEPAAPTADNEVEGHLRPLS